jgi:arsenite methyltransferase
MADQASSELREEVRSKYARAARSVLDADSGTGGCGGGPVADPCCAGAPAGEQENCFGGPLYGAGEIDGLPAEAVQASLGCGNPLAVADLREGERVLDLGSGGGIDVLLSARRVGPTGFAYGVDMTDDMLALARANAAKAGATNVEFRKGEIEALPLPDAVVDVVISNCVINLSGDKLKVLAEAARVLRPGGRFAVSDVIADPDMDDRTSTDVAAWTGCVAGALTEQEFRDALIAAGLESAEFRETHRVHEHAAAAIIRARKPLHVAAERSVSV